MPFSLYTESDVASLLLRVLAAGCTLLACSGGLFEIVGRARAWGDSLARAAQYHGSHGQRRAILRQFGHTTRRPLLERLVGPPARSRLISALRAAERLKVASGCPSPFLRALRSQTYGLSGRPAPRPPRFLYASARHQERHTPAVGWAPSALPCAASPPPFANCGRCIR